MLNVIIQKKSHHRKSNKAKEQANLVEENFVDVVTEEDLLSGSRDWWVDMGATRHICRDRSAFVSYE